MAQHDVDSSQDEIVVGHASGGQPWSETRSMWSESGAIHARLEAAEPVELWQGGERVQQPLEAARLSMELLGRLDR